LHVIQRVLPPDCEKHHYCEWLLTKVEDVPRNVTSYSFLRWGVVSSYTFLNSQNTRIWSTENPHAHFLLKLL
jgi:hypothetical protein